MARDIFNPACFKTVFQNYLDMSYMADQAQLIRSGRNFMDHLLRTGDSQLADLFKFKRDKLIGTQEFEGVGILIGSTNMLTIEDEKTGIHVWLCKSLGCSGPPQMCSMYCKVCGSSDEDLVFTGYNCEAPSEYELPGPLVEIVEATDVQLSETGFDGPSSQPIEMSEPPLMDPNLDISDRNVEHDNQKGSESLVLSSSHSMTCIDGSLSSHGHDSVRSKLSVEWKTGESIQQIPVSSDPHDIFNTNSLDRLCTPSSLSLSTDEFTVNARGHGTYSSSEWFTSEEVSQNKIHSNMFETGGSTGVSRDKVTVPGGSLDEAVAYSSQNILPIKMEPDSEFAEFPEMEMNAPNITRCSYSCQFDTQALD